MKFLEPYRYRIDLAPLKIFLSLVTIYIALMTSVAAAATATPTFDRKIDSVFTTDLKSCPVPYSADYCLKQDSFNSCQHHETSWLPWVNKYTLKDPNFKPYCPFKNTSKYHDS